MVKTEWFDKCNKNRSIYVSKAGQNWQLILPIAYKCKCGYIDKTVLNYRIRENSHSHAKRTTKESVKRCEEHKDILFNVLKRIECMPNEEKKKYKKYIRDKYRHRKYNIIRNALKIKFKIK